MKRSHDTVFIKTREYIGAQTLAPNPLAGYVKARRLSSPRRIRCSIALGAKASGAADIRISYLGEAVFEHKCGQGSLIEAGLVDGRSYTIELLGEHGRCIYKEVVAAAKEMRL